MSYPELTIASIISSMEKLTVTIYCCINFDTLLQIINDTTKYVMNDNLYNIFDIIYLITATSGYCVFNFVSAKCVLQIKDKSVQVVIQILNCYNRDDENGVI